jgi:DNA-binding SARP family transcriptional activator
VERRRKHADVQLFERLLEEVGDELFLIDLCNWGEPFLNPHLEDFVRAASARGRPLLPDLEMPWIEACRTTQRAQLVRALECLAAISGANREPALAIQYTSEVLALEPFRESAYRRLMRLHAESGNRAEALRVFARGRDLLRAELGTNPSPATETVFLEILRNGAG